MEGDYKRTYKRKRHIFETKYRLVTHLNDNQYSSEDRSVFRFRLDGLQEEPNSFSPVTSSVANLLHYCCCCCAACWILGIISFVEPWIPVRVMSGTHKKYTYRECQTVRFVKTLYQHLLEITEFFPLPDLDNSIVYVIRWTLFCFCSLNVSPFTVKILFNEHLPFNIFALNKKKTAPSFVLTFRQKRSECEESSWFEGSGSVGYSLLPGRSAKTIWAKCPCSWWSLKVKEQKEEYRYT